MVEANRSLSHDHLTQHRPDWAVWVLSKQKAQVAVKERIRAQGRTLRDYSAGDITAEADDYLDAHPELLEQAAATLIRWESAHRAKLLSRAQRKRA
jgi:hypothetical protein